MALIGVSRACSPRRSALASSSEVAIAAPRLHQVSPIQVDRRVATRTPASTAPTRTAPILIVENAEACTTSSAVRGPVRSSAPSVSTERDQVRHHRRRGEPETSDQRRPEPPGTSRQRAGWPGHAQVGQAPPPGGFRLRCGSHLPFQVACGPVAEAAQHGLRRPSRSLPPWTRRHGAQAPTGFGQGFPRAPVPSGWRCRPRRGSRRRSGPSPRPGRVGRSACARPAPPRRAASAGMSQTISNSSPSGSLPYRLLVVPWSEAADQGAGLGQRGQVRSSSSSVSTSHARWYRPDGARGRPRGAGARRRARTGRGRGRWSSRAPAGTRRR